MRKMMLALTAAGMLAVPTGLVVAQESGAEPIDPESTVLVAEQDRDQVRDRDGTCDLDGDMLQSRDRAQAHVGESSDHGAQARQRAQAEVEDGAKQASPDAECDGDQLRIQEHARIRDAADA